jgi:excisionase family DNA binding protein
VVRYVARSLVYICADLSVSRATRSPRARRHQSDWISLGEASRLLGMSQATLRRWSDDGHVSVFTTPGGHRRFSRSSLRALLPPPVAARPHLARLGVSAERMARIYRPSRTRRDAVTQRTRAPWIAALAPDDLAGFRDRGRQLVALMLEHLDAADDAIAAQRLVEAARIAAEQGRAVARLGASLSDAVEAFLGFRSPFVEHLARLSGERGLDTRRATELIMAAEAAMDRLLLATMTGHSLEAGPAPRRKGPRRVATP